MLSKAIYKLKYLFNFPAVQFTKDKDTGVIYFEQWFRGDPLERLRDRKDGPSIIRRDRNSGVVICEEWFKGGRCHRDDGPAVIMRNPDTGLVEREEWWQDGMLSRKSSPAIIKYDTATGQPIHKEWWENNNKISPQNPPAHRKPPTIL